MKIPAFCVSAVLVFAAGPALAQFAPASGSGNSVGGSIGGGRPSISGAGTGLSAPSTINPAGMNPTGNGISNPNAMPGLSTPATTTPPPPAQPIYPGVGIGGAGLPPAAVRPNQANVRPR